jgi:hypothetical protein
VIYAVVAMFTHAPRHRQIGTYAADRIAATINFRLAHGRRPIPPVILVEILRGFPHSLQASARLSHDHFLPNPFDSSLMPSLYRLK